MALAGQAAKRLVAVIVGPTAVGKSDLALALGQSLDGELISADSRQIFRYLDIGTAKPTAFERLLIPHHLVDVVEPHEEYTLAAFQADAYRSIEAALERRRLPMLVGGTGLYIRSVVEGLRIPRVAPQPTLRAELERRAEEDGAMTLHRELEDRDAEAAARIDPRNLRRVIRALEVCLATGEPISRLQAANPPPYQFVIMGLTCGRDVLYRRIDRRVEQQIDRGLVDEVRAAVARGYPFDLPAMTGLGYRQMSEYLQGKVSLLNAIQKIKHDTHRFARQQYNWFRLRDKRIHWLNRDELDWDGVVQRATDILQTARRADAS